MIYRPFDGERIYKGKRSDTKEWIWGYHVRRQNDGKDYIVVNTIGSKLNCEINNMIMTGYLVDSESVGQHTGVYDNTPFDALSDYTQELWLSYGYTADEWRGYPIFEGDIVYVDSFHKHRMQVLFGDGGYYLADKNGEYVADIHYVHHAEKAKCEVIGTVCNNPELID